jgi:hypothetical protein
MKKIILTTIAIVGFTAGSTFAQQAMSHDTGGHGTTPETHHSEVAESATTTSSAGAGMMHMHSGKMKGHGEMADTSKMMGGDMKCGKSGMMKGNGMMHGMSGGKGHGMMDGKDGMQSHGMMGLGFYMPGHEHWTSEQHQQFMDATTDIRKELIVKRFEIKEAQRSNNTTPEQIGQLDKELIDIRTKLQTKALEMKTTSTE